MNIAPIIAAAASAALWLAAAAPAHASGAVGTASGPIVGHVLQVVGSATLAGQPLRSGAAVHQGQLISTGPDGHLYLQTPDHGLLILRPSTRLRIAQYHIDSAIPTQSRFRLELESGALRSVSGRSVPAARQHFRLNTPVAAVGVVGTDFTVFSTEALTRVGVSSGAVVVSGFGNGCQPEGLGPCQGALSQVLHAADFGKVLQVTRGRVAPELLRAPVLPTGSESASPGSSQAPSPAQPSSSRPTAAPDSIPLELNPTKLASHAPLPSPAAPPPASPPPPAAPPSPAAPLLHWGRWQPIAEQAATLDLAALRAAGAHMLGLNSHYAVLREPAAAAHWHNPRLGQASFALHGHQAQVQSPAGVQVAHISHGQLQFDFVAARFSTQLQLQAPGGIEATLVGRGSVAPNGQFDAAPLHFDGSNLHLSGSLAQPAAATAGATLPPAQAAYVFQSTLSSGHQASGVTFWQQRP